MGNLPDPETKVKRRKEPPKDRWVIYSSEGIREKVTLIATLYRMKLSEVVDRAVICYANSLKLSEQVRTYFPEEGLAVPPLSVNRAARPPSLTKFFQRQELKRKGLEESEEAEADA